MSEKETNDNEINEVTPSETDTVIEAASEKVAAFLEDLAPTQRKRLPVEKQLAVLGVLAIGIFGVGGFTYIKNSLDKSREIADTASLASQEASVAPVGGELVDPFVGLSLGAQSVLVFDVRQQEIIYERSADTKWPLASITKLMTALVAHEIVDDQLVVPITKEALEQSGESGLLEGQRFSLGRLMDLILLTSSNDGAYALAAAAGAALDSSSPAEAFVKAMNVRAKELGLSNTYFRNPTGLDITEDEAGAYGTARDVAKLMEYIYTHHPYLLEETTNRNSAINDLSGVAREARNTNPVIDAIPGALGSKTGYTTLSGGNLAVVFNAGADRPVIVVVLGSSHQGRFSDVLKLVEATREELSIEQE